MIDLNTVAAIVSGGIALIGGSTIAKYTVPAIRKLGTLDQVAKDGDAMVQAADKALRDTTAVISSSQSGTLTGAQLQMLQTDFENVVADFKKTVTDVKSLL